MCIPCGKTFFGQGHLSSVKVTFLSSIKCQGYIFQKMALMGSLAFHNHIMFALCTVSEWKNGETKS